MPPMKSDIESITRQASGRSPWLRRLTWLAVLAIGLGGAWYWWSSASQQALPVYTTEKLVRSDIIVLVTATGTVEPTDNVEISSELSGTVRTVEADFNDKVTKGQVLARLDTDKLEANVEHSRAALAATEAKLAEANVTLTEMKDNYDRAVLLEEKHVATMEVMLKAKAAHDRAAAAINSARADIRVAKADLKINEANLSKACICSSIDGVVLSRNIEVGQIVASSLSAPILFTLAADLRHMELQVAIDEADIGKVSVGNPAVFSVEAYQGQTFPAVISDVRFAPETVDGVVTYEAILSIENAEMLLRPGMTATADIKVAEIRDTLSVSNAALRFSPPVAVETTKEGGSGLLGMLIKRPSGGASTTPAMAATDGHRDIWILKNGEAVAVPIMPGESDGARTAILKGDVAEGDLVITDLASK